MIMNSVEMKALAALLRTTASHPDHHLIADRLQQAGEAKLARTLRRRARTAKRKAEELAATDPRRN